MAMPQQHQMPDGSMMAGSEHPGQMPAGQGQMQGGRQRATPEQQAQYTRFVTRAIQLIYSDEMMPVILETLKSDPKEGLGKAAAMVVGRVGGAAEQAGEQLDRKVVGGALKEVVEDLANLATKAGIHDFEKDQDALEGAWLQAVDEYRMMLQQAGEIDQGEAKQAFGRMQEEDKSGALEQRLRGLAGEEGGSAPKGPAPRRGMMAEEA